MVRTQPLTSVANPLIKDVRRAIARGRLTDDGLCVAESFHLLQEAFRSQREVPVILVSESAPAIQAPDASRVLVLADALFRSIASTETSQGVIALVRPPEWSIQQLFYGRSLVIVLDGVQDPGNAGAIVRAAEAFGATGIVCIKGTVNPWNPKTLRASAGSLFRVPLVAGMDTSLALAALRQNNVELYAAMPFTEGQRTASDVDLTRDCAIIIGSEGRGIGKDLRAAAEDIAIPTVAVESLNAAVAASVLLYEARRQRAAA